VIIIVSHDEKVKENWRPGRDGLGTGGCDKLCPAATGLAWLHRFPVRVD
jgi:hypothetical protein